VQLLADIRFATRSFQRNPGFAVVAALTLALGIGSTTAIFSVVNAVLLQPLPFPESERLVALGTRLTDGRLTGGDLSPREKTHAMADGSSLASVAGTYRWEPTFLDGQGNPLAVSGFLVTDGFMSTFGATMHLGRYWTAEEHVVGSEPSLVLSYRAWRDFYDADPGVLGTTVETANGGLPVIGVAAPTFDFPEGTDAWLNLQVDPDNGGHILEGYARLLPGVTLDEARADLQRVAMALDEEFPRTNRNREFTLVSLHDAMLGKMKAGIGILFGATASLLLIACANVSSLLLSRATGRAREMAIRSALGAQRGRIIRQLLTESMLLAGIGSAAGLALAVLAMRALAQMAPADLPRIDELAIDTGVLLFALLTTALAAVLFGLAPALRLAGTDLRGVLQEEARGSSGGIGRSRVFASLTVAQIALAVILVIGAGLLALSFERLRHGDPGFVADDVVTLLVRLPQRDYPPSDGSVQEAVRQLETGMKGLPDVAAVGATSTLPLAARTDFLQRWNVVGEAAPTEAGTTAARIREVTPGFVEAMRMQLVAGRALSADDRADSARVALINEAFAWRYFPGSNPIGRHIRRGDGPNTPPEQRDQAPLVEVVGVLRDAKYKSLNLAAEAQVFLPHAQGGSGQVTFSVRTAGADSLALVGSLRQVIRDFDRNLPIEIATMDQVLDVSVVRERFTSQLLGLFALAALLLASVGIYGVISYSVSQRGGELAIRAALGASAGDLRGLVMRQGVALSLAGVSIGLAGAWVLRGLLASQLYEVNAGHPGIFALVAVVLTTVALLATYVPARRATQAEASAVLRND